MQKITGATHPAGLLSAAELLNLTQALKFANLMLAESGRKSEDKEVMGDESRETGE
jgi:hypothetical protein